MLLKLAPFSLLSRVSAGLHRTVLYVYYQGGELDVDRPAISIKRYDHHLKSQGILCTDGCALTYSGFLGSIGITVCSMKREIFSVLALCACLPLVSMCTSNTQVDPGDLV